MAISASRGRALSGSLLSPRQSFHVVGASSREIEGSGVKTRATRLTSR